MKMPSSMGSHFAQVPKADVPRSQIRRNTGWKGSFDAGYLVPVFVDDVLPGDTMRLRMTAFARLATPLHPIMDNIWLESFFFFVPNRLIWSNWQKFCGEQVNPGDSTDFTIPRLADGYTVAEGDVADLMGIPLGLSTTSVFVSALPFRAMRLIWNQWFRDENLQNSLTVSTGDGPDSALTTLRKRGKRHDYFTSCLPWPQKGDSVTLPLGTQAPIQGLGVGTQSDSTGPQTVYETEGSTSYSDYMTDAAQVIYIDSDGHPTTPLPQIYADLTNATAASINELRQAFQVQKLLERDARGGTRYTEIVKSHFRVTSPDARLQRAEFLGGGRSAVQFNVVPQTSEEGTTAQGNLAAFGTATVGGHGFVKSFTEHGYIVGLVCAFADLSYQQGLERHWSRQTRYDFYWPALAHLGEQAVLNKEIYVQNAAADDLVFGYQERYAEYRYKPRVITSAMRSTAATPLDTWHLAQEFSALPTLGSTFIEEDPPIDRVIAVPSEPHFIMDAHHEYVCARPMPVYGVPGFTDHF